MAKTIGILGGMGPEATVDCFHKIVKYTPAKKDQDHLHIIVDCNPEIPDRTNAILLDKESPVPFLTTGCQNLEKLGVDFIIIPCNTAHFYLNKLLESIHTPILPIFDAVVHTLRSEFPHVTRVGLLATTGTIKTEIYQKRLSADGIDTLLPDDQYQATVMLAIKDIKGTCASRAREEITHDLTAVANKLINDGAQGIIGGCTEIPLALSQECISVPFFDSQLILARHAIQKAGLQPLP